MMCSEGRSSSSEAMKARSIFSLSKWNPQPPERGLAGAEIVERDVTRSGAGPRRLRPCRVRRGVSVISISRRRGSKPVRSRMASICRPVFWSTSCEGDRLKDRNSSFGQSRAASVAFLSTSCDIGPMMPRSSAIGMKTTGEIGPRSRSVQRASVSKPTVRRVLRSTIGWKCGSTSPAGGAPQRPLDAGDALGGFLHLARVDDDRPRPERLAVKRVSPCGSGYRWSRRRNDRASSRPRPTGARTLAVVGR